MKIEHNFRHICYDVVELMKGVNSISTFMRNLNKQSILHPERWPSEDYKGAGFEFLIEVLIKNMPIDKRINIVKYSPILSEDYGADGVGKSHNGNPHTVQIKYRSDIRILLDANIDKLTNFSSYSLMNYGNKVDMTIFTTAKGVHPTVLNKMLQGIEYKGKVKVFGYEDLRNLLNGCEPFWNLLKESLDNTKNIV